MSGGEMSGVDLARVALRAAMEQARENSGRTAKARQQRPTTVMRRDGREPLNLAAAIGALVTERAWELPAAGASLRDRWAAIAPDLAGHVAAVGYDPDAGRITVCPKSWAWATKVRLEQARIIAAANESADRTVVRALRILAPGSVPMPGLADVNPAPAAAPIGAVRTWETASEGYRRALAAHQQVAPPRRVDPAIAEAVKRQTAAMRALSAQAFPETDTVQDKARPRSRRPVPSAVRRPRPAGSLPCAALAGERAARTDATELGRTA